MVRPGHSAISPPALTGLDMVTVALRTRVLLEERLLGRGRGEVQTGPCLPGYSSVHHMQSWPPGPRPKRPERPPGPKRQDQGEHQSGVWENGLCETRCVSGLRTPQRTDPARRCGGLGGGPARRPATPRRGARQRLPLSPSPQASSAETQLPAAQGTRLWGASPHFLVSV